MAANDQEPTPEQPEEEERSGTYMEYEPSKDPVVVQTARKVRRVGYTIAVILLIWLNLPILIAVISGALTNEVVDPYTERPVDQHQTQDDCEKWGFELLGNASAAQKDKTVWAQKCGTRYPTLLVQVTGGEAQAPGADSAPADPSGQTP